MALRRHSQVVRRAASRPRVKTAVIASAAAMMATLGTGIVIVDQFANSARTVSYMPAETLSARTVVNASSLSGGMIATSDDWHEMVKSREFWSRIGRQSGSSRRTQEPPNRLGSSSPRNVPEGSRGLFADSDDGDDETWGRKNGDNTYRTVCVRLCDGFYTPLSFSTTRDKLERDADRCEASCGGQARMFYYRNPGAEIEDMEDLDGKPYRKLPTAFLYRTSYNAQCTCRPHPWQQEALDRHKLYALQEAGSKGDKAARMRAGEIVARQKKAEADAEAEKAAAEKAARKAKAAEKSGKKPRDDKSAALAPIGAELIRAAMTLPAAKSTVRPITRTVQGDARSYAPAVLKPSLVNAAPARPSPFELLAATRTRTADVNGPRQSHPVVD